MDGVRGGLTRKIDVGVADLAGYRADTEGHRAGYRISETQD